MCGLPASALPLFALAADAPLRYKVDIEAPRELAQGLSEGLRVVRWEQEPNMSALLLDKLIEESLDQVREAAGAEGYFSPRVTSEIDRSPDPWLVKIRLEPGTPTRVTNIDIRFTGPAAEDPDAGPLARRIRQDWRLRAGQVFRQADWDAAKTQALRELSGWRYAAAQIAASRAEIDPATASAKLTVELASGPAFRFGELRVSGLKRYDGAVVTNMSPVHRGELYERDKLDSYQRVLLFSGYFVSAQIGIDTDPARAADAPVTVSVIESNNQSVEAGVGYGTDTGARVNLRYTNHDIFGTTWRQTTQLRYDAKIQDLRFDFDSPPRSDASWNNVFARTQQNNIQNVLTREYSAGFAHNWGFERTPSAAIVSAHHEEQDVPGQETETRHALYFGYRRTLRQTDNPVAPRSGYMGMLEAGGSPAGLASRNFWRIAGNASMFVPLGRRDDLILRGEMGQVHAGSREGIPSSFLFRTGGDTSVRGYAYQSLGVPVLQAVLGARYMALLSAEVVHWVTEDWGLAAFLDAGDAWDPQHAFKAAKGYGGGARFRTPIGPIRIDLAYGERNHEYRLHFSVGYTF